MDMKIHEKTDKENMGKPTVCGMTLGNVWFSSEIHRNNFKALMERFKAHTIPDYAAACYVVAHPEIYGRIDWINCGGPIEWYWGEWTGVDDNDENGNYLESVIVGQLSSAYRGLVQAAVELYTGRQHYFDLMGWLGNAGDEVYKLFVQALEIRRDRYVIDLT
ncbi:hypothetical protein YDYSY3_38270 [Paenibacillus chitinolyticus]|uniref:DUF2538 family protein n=1 Tax=Paenibacillus chitinolyticus TaxID=79263 RepID=UPI0026E4F44D|nr:DUF2538 family protein [Paenibacillus chitinolyticus]GKS12827.1 hypothetical protein YDYSY3_38270 [Paenibacillus chitinolyticus]